MISRNINYSKAEIDSVLALLGLNLELVLKLQQLNDGTLERNNGPNANKSIKEAVNDYLERGFYKKSDRTKARYEVVLLDFQDFIEKHYGKEILISEITLHQCEEYLYKMKSKRPGRHQVLKEKKDVAPSTNNLRVAAIRGLFNHCKKYEWVLDSPADKIELLREEEILPNFLRLHECNVLLQVTKSKLRYRKRDYALTTFMLYTGARIEEVCQATIYDIDF
jgi:site-specific recombinase XerD